MATRISHETASTRRVPTIMDVAALAEVSKSTVSNVIRAVPAVSGSTRARVIEAIEQLGYRPNVLARQLVQQRTTILGVVVGDLANPFYGEMAKLLERYAARAGYTAMFCNTEGDAASELAGVNMLLEYRAAGIVFLAHADQSGAVERALARRVPAVFVGSRQDWCDSVAVDDERGGRWATEHLLELGHRRIVCLTTPAEEDSDAARIAGYGKAMALAGSGQPRVLRWLPGSEEAEHDGRPVSLAHLFRAPNGVSGVFATNDLTAIDLMEFLDRVNLRVPADVSIVGFDNVALAGLARISLTTIAQPRDDLARQGIETVAARIEGHAAGPPRRLTAEVDLVVRGSTARPCDWSNQPMERSTAGRSG
jgi:LacI family transcriptional regulator